MTTPGEFSPDAKSAGRRALRNTALTYLSYAEGSPARAKAAFDGANNMTDLSHALTILAHRFPDSAEAKAALETFRSRFSDNALVVDKWFAIQAGHSRVGRGRSRQGADGKPALQAHQPEPHALAGRHVCLRQPDRLRPGRWRRLPFPRRADPRHRQAQPAGSRPPADLDALLALAGEARAGPCPLGTDRIERAAKLSTDVRDLVERMLKG